MEARELKGKNGRRVLVEGVIDYPTEGGYCFVQFDIVCPDELSRCQVPHSAIREILPEPINVGDRVTAVGIPGVAEVRHIDGDDAWLLYHETGIRNDAPLSDLTLVEPGQ